MKVSVVIPVYNAAAYVGEAVASALEQPETGEVILVEDGSPDDSLVVCQRLEGQHAAVRLLRHPNGENRGAGASRNLGIDQATCPLVAFLDADDLFLPGRFSRVMEILRSHPDADGVHEAVEGFCEDEASRARWISTGWFKLIGMIKEVGPERLFEALVGGGCGTICTDGIVVRRTLFAKSGMFDSRFLTAQDTHLWIRMAAVGRLYPGLTDRTVSRFRIHGGNRVTGMPRDEHAAGKYEVWRDLMCWGRARPLPEARMQLLARRYVKSARRIIHQQSGFEAWRTARLTFKVLMRNCPRPWRVDGFWPFLSEASGFGLALDRTLDGIGLRRKRAVERAGVPEAPRIALVIVWFGPFPFWMPAFLLSCRRNPTVEWLVFSDTEPPPNLPANVKIQRMDLATFNRRASKALGFNVRITPAYVYKLCDLKIMYGEIFREELEGFDFWGCCDMDIFWGNIRGFITDAVLHQHDILTARPRKISGHFCLFRNLPEWNQLYRRIPNIDSLAASSNHVAIDEKILHAFYRAIGIEGFCASGCDTAGACRCLAPIGGRT